MDAKPEATIPTAHMEVRVQTVTTRPCLSVIVSYGP